MFPQIALLYQQSPQEFAPRSKYGLAVNATKFAVVVPSEAFASNGSVLLCHNNEPSMVYVRIFRLNESSDSNGVGNKGIVIEYPLKRKMLEEYRAEQ